MKRMFSTIDLSPRIFSSNIDLPRQLIRRIWMDTWSALLLCNDSTRTEGPQQVEFSNVSGAAPFLLGFKGTVAERHMENIKMMKAIGAKNYIEACRQLTAEETLLRQKVYNFYNGPGIHFELYICWSKDCFYWSGRSKIKNVTTWFGRGLVHLAANWWKYMLFPFHLHWFES